MPFISSGMQSVPKWRSLINNRSLPRAIWLHERAYTRKPPPPPTGTRNYSNTFSPLLPHRTTPIFHKTCIKNPNRSWFAKFFVAIFAVTNHRYPPGYFWFTAAMCSELTRQYIWFEGIDNFNIVPCNLNTDRSIIVVLELYRRLEKYAHCPQKWAAAAIAANGTVILQFCQTKHVLSAAANAVRTTSIKLR